jgi:hypothetical protein
MASLSGFSALDGVGLERTSCGLPDCRGQVLPRGHPEPRSFQDTSTGDECPEMIQFSRVGLPKPVRSYPTIRNNSLFLRHRHHMIFPASVVSAIGHIFEGVDQPLDADR